MQNFRITDIEFHFRNNGATDSTSYSRNTYLDMAMNKSFYSKLSDIIVKKTTGNVSAIIEELYIPQEMWDAGIWEKYVLLKGTALFVRNGATETECAVIELVLQIGSNPSPLFGKYLEYVPAQNVIKLSNLNVNIIGNSIKLQECE